MLIFRMETATGVGMYHNDASECIINNGTSDSKRWPMPYDDDRFKTNKEHHLRENYDNEMFKGSQTQTMFREWCEDLRKCGLFNFYDENLYRFGFNSYEQMSKWIYEFEWKRRLVEVGVNLNVYEVDRQFAILGYTQCTFRLDRAKLLHSFAATASEERIMHILPQSQSVVDYHKDFLL